MTKVEFKFDLDDKVETLIGDKGIIHALGYDERGTQYDVVTKHGEAWYKEKELIKIN